MARRSDHSRDELRALILDTSWNIVSNRGHEALSARHVAKEIGYTPGTIYNIFQSMDDLCVHLNARTLDMLYDALDAPQCNDPNKSPIQNIKKMAEIYLFFAQSYGAHWKLLFTLDTSDWQGDVQWYGEKIEKLFQPLESLLKKFLPNSREMECKDAARILWASVHGLCFLQETGKISVVAEERSASQMSDYLIETFVAGLDV